MHVPKRMVRLSVQSLLILGVVAAVYVLSIWRNYLPLAIHRNIPLLPKAPIVLDLEIEDCLLNYKCRQGEDGWYKHPKDLRLGGSRLKSTWLYTKRVPEEELSVKDHTLVGLAVADAAGTVPREILAEIIAANTGLDGGAEYSMLQAEAFKLGWSLKSQDYGVWVKHGPFDPSKSITGIKILFGESAVYPVPNWHLLPSGLPNLAKDAPPRLAYRVGARVAPEKPILNVDKTSGKFKIAQFADLHMSETKRLCDQPRVQEKDENGLLIPCYADEETVKFMNSVLDKERPDLIVYSGDQLQGKTIKDPETALMKALAPAIEREIPFALIFGNHDCEGPLDNQELLDLMADLPYSLIEAGPEEVLGVGNYVVTAHVNNHNALSIYLLDSHTWQKKTGQYQEIDISQHEWLRRAHQKIAKEQKQYSKLPMSMAFLHIPLPEFDNGYLLVGNGLESVISAKNDVGTLDVLRDIGVMAVGSGHDHCNDFCKFADDENKAKLWLCYGGGTGYGGYAGYSDDSGQLYERRIRIYEVDTQLSAISTWKRVNHQEEIIDYHFLVENGKPRL